MVHYCFNTQAVHCEKLSHLHGGTQWLCLYSSESAASQDRCKHSMVHLLPAFHLPGCLGAAAGCLWDRLDAHEHCRAALDLQVLLYWQGGFLFLVKPLLQASHTEELRLIGQIEVPFHRL